MTVESTALPYGRIHHFIGGRAVKPSGDSYLVTVNPADRSALAEIAAGTAEDVDAAVDDAANALAVWRAMAPAARGRILGDIARGLRARADEFARMECLDNGKPISQALADVEVSARYFEFYSGLADKLNGQTIPIDQEHLSYTTWDPYGVVAHITPWNAPLQQAARGLAPCLAAGNVVVVKPAEDTSISTVALAELAVACGLPPGVLNVVTGLGEVAGDRLVRHPAVRKVAFTGSVATGRLVGRTLGDRIIPATLELGGKSANIVFADADLDEAVRGSATAINHNAGQICSAGSRLLVHHSIHDAFVEKLAALNREIVVGPGLDDPDMGPLTNEEQLNRVREYIAIGEGEGAQKITGGTAAPGRSGDGYFVEPTIFVGVTNTMRIAQEEIFGPVIGVQSFGDDEEALAIANDSDFGLVAGLWTRDVSRVHRIAAQLDVGQVNVNQWFAGGVETPFGGVKSSGYGREKGIEAVQHYLQSKTVNIRL